MRIPEGVGSWQKLYIEDVLAAENELRIRKFEIDPNTVLGDIYVLPSRHHQTFYAKLMIGHGFFKGIFVKPLQNSVWFSEPVYDYSISEAKLFEKHAKRRGRLICRTVLVDKHFIANIRNAINLLAEHQPEDTVVTAPDTALTAIRLFDKGKIIRRIYYTDASRLAFKDGENPEAVDFLNNLWLEAEKIVGIGE